MTKYQICFLFTDYPTNKQTEISNIKTILHNLPLFYSNYFCFYLILFALKWPIDCIEAYGEISITKCKFYQ